jgi:hypothetical protein
LEFAQGKVMGEQAIDPLIDGSKQKAKETAVVMMLLALFAPVMINIYLISEFSHINVLSMLWTYSSSSSYPVYPSSGFQIMPIYILMSIFPFLLLRLVPVFQIHRYYSGRTTRRRALIASFIGDGYFLFTALPAIIMPWVLGVSMFMFPLPFQVIFGILMLWRYPIPDPTTPWEDLEEPKSWWDKKSESQQGKPPDEQQQKPPDDEDKLW